MRVFLLFYSLAYSIFFGIGYWYASDKPAPSIDQQIMQHVEILDSERPASFIYRLDNGRWIHYSPITGKLTASSPIGNSDDLDLKIDPALLSMIGGASIGLNIDTLAKNKLLIRLFNRVSGKSKTQRALGTLLGAISGYSLGTYVGRKIATAPKSENVEQFLRKEETWKTIEAQYAIYRLEKLGETLDDLPVQVREKYAPKLTATQQTILRLRSQPGNDFIAEMSLVLALEQETAPHFNLIKGTIENSWGNFLEDFRLGLAVVKWASLIIFSFALIMWGIEGYKALRTKVSRRRKRR